MNNRPFSSFALFGSMRSGSNLLEKYLEQYDNLVCHGEVFNPGLIRESGLGAYLGVTRADRLRNPELMLAAILKADPGKISGYRIFQNHNPWAIDNALADPTCAKIILTRDPVESFVSLGIARITSQWMISDVAHRKPAKIHFDLVEFSEYAMRRSAYYSKLTKSLAKSGQPFFEVDYAKLNDLATINKLAAFLGANEIKTALEQPIKRQNPGALVDKIINYKEVCRMLDLPEVLEPSPPVLLEKKERGTDLSRIFFCKSKAITLAPVPSVPDTGVRNWLKHYDGEAPVNGFTQHDFAAWQSAHPAALFFSVVGHPVERAYRAFMQKIFSTSPGGYRGIRQKLENRFGLSLPKGDISCNHPRAKLESGGYGVDEHRVSFKQFLAFIAGNLANETDIRKDGKWQLQSDIISRYRVLHPALHVLKAETLRTDLTYLENRLGLKPYFGWEPELEPRFSYPLSEIYDAEIESLSQAAYGQDYQEFGYSALGSL